MYSIFHWILDNSLTPNVPGILPSPAIGALSSKPKYNSLIPGARLLFKSSKFLTKLIPIPAATPPAKPNNPP